MNIIYRSLLPFLLFSLSQMMDNIMPLEASNSTAYENKSLPYFADNWNKTLVLHSVTLIDGTDNPPKPDAMIIIDVDNNKIIGTALNTGNIDYQWTSEKW